MEEASGEPEDRSIVYGLIGWPLLGMRWPFIENLLEALSAQGVQNATLAANFEPLAAVLTAVPHKVPTKGNLQIALREFYEANGRDGDAADADGCAMGRMLSKVRELARKGRRSKDKKVEELRQMVALDRPMRVPRHELLSAPRGAPPVAASGRAPRLLLDSGKFRHMKLCGADCSARVVLCLNPGSAALPTASAGAAAAASTRRRCRCFVLSGPSFPEPFEQRGCRRGPH